MHSKEILAALAHVCSQVIGKWLPLPAQLQIDPGKTTSRAEQVFKDLGFAGLDITAWKEILVNEISSFQPDLPWLGLILQRRDVSIQQIAEAAFQHFSGIEKNRARYVGFYDCDYPPLLKYIARPPLGLSILGDIELLSAPSIAVIGSRRTTYEALRASVDVGVSCQRHGLVVVSGGALGCDIAVHEGMLVGDNDQVRAVVVQAGGLTTTFPRTNERVFSEILSRGGSVISERLWFQEVRPHDFPSRNRIVSGLCSATVVMAAAVRSGSLITATEALEQGRDVYVFCHDASDVRFEGSARLIEDGATPFFSADELIKNLSFDYSALTASQLRKETDYCQNVREVDTFIRDSS
jgi:DNA protecting protein DprA